MDNFSLTTTILLPALLVAGVTMFIVFNANDGIFDKIIDDISIKTTPSTDNIPLTREWTGNAVFDQLFAVFLILARQLLGGRHPAGTLHTLHFFGQMGACWTLMQLEAKREDNNRRIFECTTLITLLYPNVSFAITIPLWCILHLRSLPRTNSATLTVNLCLPASEARILPWAMTLGYVLPIIAMALSLSRALAQQFWPLFPLFPFWVYLASNSVLRSLFGAGTSMTAWPLLPLPPAASYHATTTPHLFALLLATITHTATLSFSLSALLFPALFHPEMAVSLHPAAVFLPKLSLAGATEVELAGGATRFLQWDDRSNAPYYGFL
ncbi:Citreoviridin biosynthesis protein D [Lasiodiplodia hormozganensis]|uniref:Citreoviridin biosynthesis protein D n=1 Tax=Lasiodiplodia hormozganensis TaxID=869390 RepID=A0AA39W3N1_9PEZI|nr:Citreoviridin biosynthesis protein D [Lasiodiplodia hormozganensis]